MAQAAGGFGDRGIAGFVGVRSGLPVPGDPHQDDAAVAFTEYVVAQAPLLQSAWSEVLDDDVAVVDELEEEVSSLLLTQVEGDGLLVARVHRPEEVVAVEFGLPPGAQRIRRARGFDLDDFRAHVTEQSTGERPRDQRSDLDDPDPVEWPRRCGHRATAKS